MKRMLYIVMAFAIVLGLTQCKKEQPEALNGERVHIMLNVDGGNSNSRVIVDPTGHTNPDYATVTFENGDVIYVGYNNAYVGTLTYSDGIFSGDITIAQSGDQPLHFYCLGGKGFTPTVNGNTATVVISDQSTKYPVISYAASKQNYPSAGNKYTAKLMNKCSIMKFNVTTPSTTAIRITGMNNKVTVNFGQATEEGNGFSYSQVDGGLITMPAKDASNATWAIVLPTEGTIAAGAEGSVYTFDGYKGTRPAITEPILANQYLSDGVSLTAETLDMKYAVLTFEAKTAGAVVQFDLNNVTAGKVQYSLDGITWETYTDNASITLTSAGDKVMFLGNWGKYDESKFTCSADCYVYGNVNSLQNTITYPTLTNLGNRAFYRLFQDNTHIKNHATKDIVLPATNLGNSNCYNSMFKGCTGLTRVPQLYATTLGNYCFQSMFEGCTGLTDVPSDYLPATTLTEGCYLQMFYGCTNLTNVPNLPAMTATPRCYTSMFEGCTSLTSLPSDLLPATTLAAAQNFNNVLRGCYDGMFQGCTNLTSVPNLPAATLTERCYRNMFRGAGMTTVPTDMMENATTMAKESCASMFRECPNLTNTPEIFATTLAELCCDAMFYNSVNITTASTLHATTLAKQCYQSMFSGCTSLTSVTCLATDISATDCTITWLHNVATTGTLTTPSSTPWTSGTSGIPSGWTRVATVDVNGSGNIGGWTNDGDDPWGGSGGGGDNNLGGWNNGGDDPWGN